MLILQCSHVAADGGLSLDRTRVIFQQANMAQSVTLRNRGEALYLVKSVITRDIAGKVTAPFWVTPPLFRLEPRSQNTLRILRQGKVCRRIVNRCSTFQRWRYRQRPNPPGTVRTNPKLRAPFLWGSFSH